MNISNEIAELTKSIEVYEANIKKLKDQLSMAKKALKAFTVLKEKAESIEVPKETKS